MNPSRCKHITFCLAAGGLLVIGWLTLLRPSYSIVHAAPATLFASASGDSSSCAQTAPCKLSTALDRAGEGGTIYVAQGIYTGTGDAVVTLTKSVSLYGGWDGSLAAPVVRDPTAYPTTLDGEGQRRVVEISGDITPTLDGFVITRGNASNAATDAGHGGGIYSANAEPVIQNNILTNNVGYSGTVWVWGRGAGVYLYRAAASALISGNQILSNTASLTVTGEGGGLYIYGSDATIRNNLIQDNVGSRYGGGLYVLQGSPRVLNNEIRANRAGRNAGGIYVGNFPASPLIQGNLIVGNSTGPGWNGGGILISGKITLTLIANRILSNTAGTSAGIGLATSSYFTVANNIIAHNNNGGIRMWENTRYGLIANNTIVFNTGTEGGIRLAYGNITPTLVNNIVVSNTYGIRAHANASGTLDYNDVWGNTTLDYDLPGALGPGNHDLQSDPLLAAPDRDDYHLRASSPCVDAGTIVPIATDMDGDPRPLGAGYDLGADESMLKYVYLPLVLLGFVDTAEAINLGDPKFNASGRGDVTTTGSITGGEPLLSVANVATWQTGHGIRVRRAGEDLLVHHADSDWVLPPDAPGGAGVVHDMADKIEGEASVRCSYTGAPPDADGDGVPDPVNLCEVDLGGPIAMGFDELHFWIKSSVATDAAHLRIRILRIDDPLNPYDCAAPILHGRCPTFELDIPALNTDTWSEVFVELERRTGNGIVDHFSGGHRIVALECREQCDGIVVHLDDIWLVKDLVATVAEIQKTPGDRATFRLNRGAGRTVSDETVYHDDTVAVRTWLQEADRSGGAALFAPAGVYYINQVDLFGVGGVEGSYSLPLYNDTHLKCAGQVVTTFKNTGRSATGPGAMFRAAAPAPANIVIENCGFDWNGWNLQDFASMVVITPHTEPGAAAQNIYVRHNKFFDSNLPGTEGCDFGQDECATRQRHHILVQRVDGVWIEHNLMSDGGRIKVGGAGLGRNMHIQHNVLDLVNDNGITIVEYKLAEAATSTTEHIEITDNIITNPVSSGIFFGADGEEAGLSEGMVLRDVVIARNRISGFFVGAGIIGQLPRTTEDVQIVDNFVENTRDSDISSFVSGILLNQQSPEADPTTDLRIEGNTVLASGPHSVLNVGGIVLRTANRMSGLVVSGNEVRCEGCPTDMRFDALAAGIWLWFGDFEHVAIHANRVIHANNALQLGSSATITDASIEGNEFLDSVNPWVGQITLSADSGDTIEARVAGNRIHGGAGYGILCSGSGTFLLTDLELNDLADNAGGNILGCP